MYQIVIDSCGELTDELKKDGHFQTVSLELEIDGYRIRDDETFDQKDFCAECGRARIVQSRPVRLPSSIWRHAAKRRSACMS